MKHLFKIPEYFGHDLIQWAITKQKTELLLDCSASGNVKPSIIVLCKHLGEDFTFTKQFYLDACRDSGGWSEEELVAMTDTELVHKAVFANIPDHSDFIIDILEAIQDKTIDRNLVRKIAKIYDDME
ncbi:hypothetical protein UFOVP434_85 [uncultured Caudovirales phage]|uniref:Uncharacterized protein n=1 Tax=uncultured Caudovirales phage TaxID=2100421 RepID=A0A6J5M7Z6_9CAUD|nr:hypothetical protein UFOVP434_85 [uncultured Caudovirales phage]